MSHFSVLVIGDDVEGQLAPFNENRETTKEAKWDWYSIGGRWGGYFTLKPGRTGRLGDPSTFDRIDGDKRDHSKVDQARKGDIDLEAMRAESKRKAEQQYDHFALVTTGLPWPESWDSIRKRLETIEEAREFYHAQSMIKAMKQDKELLWCESHEEFGQNRAQYVERETRNAIRTFAVVKNRTWYEKGQMGWWGMVANEQDTEQWSWQFEQLIESLSDDTLFTIVDCHI